MKNKWWDFTEESTKLGEAYIDQMLEESSIGETNLCSNCNRNEAESLHYCPLGQIKEFLDKNFYQPYPNKNIWASYEEVQDDGGFPSILEPVFNEWKDLNVTHAHKDFCMIKVYFFGFDQKEGQIGKRESNCKIELYLNSYYTWDTFFEGYVPDLTTLKIIFNCIGISYTE